jgi:hypothetical protein
MQQSIIIYTDDEEVLRNKKENHNATNNNFCSRGRCKSSEQYESNNATTGFRIKTRMVQDQRPISVWTRNSYQHSAKAFHLDLSKAIIQGEDISFL